MKTWSLRALSGAVLVTVMASTAAYAQQGPDHGPGGQGNQGGQHGQPGGQMQHGGPGPSHDAHGGPAPMQGGRDMHADRGPGGPGPGGDWRHRGGRLPGDYRDRQYVIDDWRGYDLQPPPRGYHWVGVNGEYLLVGVASGIITQIITGR